MKIVDAKGKLCPQPLIMTKKALLTMEEDETLKILLDNENARFNVTRFLQDNGMNLQVNEVGNVVEIMVSKKGGQIEQSIPEAYCEIPATPKGDYVVCVKKRSFGEGDPELGGILMNGFFNTLPNVSTLPKSIIFVNSGISLVLQDSPVLKPLQELAEKGVEILICGTCIEYYNKKQEIAVGQISNMLDILEKVIGAAKVINP